MYIYIPFVEYTVYILFSENFGKHYTGYTSDLDTRIISHNEFGHGWTAKYRPWKLIFSKSFNTKNEAMKFEKWLKSGMGRDFIKTLKH